MEKEVPAIGFTNGAMVDLFWQYDPVTVRIPVTAMQARLLFENMSKLLKFQIPDLEQEELRSLVDNIFIATQIAEQSKG